MVDTAGRLRRLDDTGAGRRARERDGRRCADATSRSGAVQHDVGDISVTRSPRARQGQGRSVSTMERRDDERRRLRSGHEGERLRHRGRRIGVGALGAPHHGDLTRARHYGAGEAQCRRHDRATRARRREDVTARARSSQAAREKLCVALELVSGAVTLGTEDVARCVASRAPREHPPAVAWATPVWSTSGFAHNV